MILVLAVPAGDDNKALVPRSDHDIVKKLRIEGQPLVAEKLDFLRDRESRIHCASFLVLKARSTFRLTPP